MDSTGTDGKEPVTAALSDNALRVRRVRSLTPAQREALGRLLPQLSPRLDGLAETQAARIVASPQTALLIAERGSELVGALTLVWYDVPSGRKAWIEDVVVDAAHRRRPGVGRRGGCRGAARRGFAGDAHLVAGAHGGPGTLSQRGIRNGGDRCLCPEN